ncbi:MAG: HPF/RaiA family ribosome-associated protein [Planctomycetales bacterium]|nr:HPF/RaiA family ribosome-associated protein [Planctomycetales bacterium]
MNIRPFIELPEKNLEAFAEERIDLVLGRFADRIAHFDIHVRAEHSTHGAEEYLCTCDVKLHPRGTIHVHANESSAQNAIIAAVHRAETVLAKTVDRGHRSKAVRHNGGGVRHLNDALDSEDPSEDASLNVSEE